MTKSNSNNTPAAWTIIPHYLFGGASFLAVTVLLLWVIPDSGTHFFHPSLLGITHLAVLGWITMIIFGALYQLVPVILSSSLYSEKLVRITFWILATGTITLSISFWNFRIGFWLPFGGLLVLGAFLLFSFNILKSIARGKKKKLQGEFIKTAIIWLVLTGVLGLLLAINLRFPFLETPHLELLKLHAHMGFLGWFLLLIIGVASELIPMFLITKGLDEKPLEIGYYAINGALLLMIPAFWMEWGNLPFLFVTLLLVGGLASFGYFLIQAFRKRIRKQLDIGMQTTGAAFLLLLLPITFGSLALLLDSVQFSLVYGTSILLGMISLLITGQTYKTLPFIVWLHKYGKKVGKEKIPQPKDLYSQGQATLHFLTFLPALVFLIIGLAGSWSILSFTGATLFIITALLYSVNLLRIVFKTPKSHDNP